MKIKFYGGTESVTGSCHILYADGLNILLDCGMFQGSEGDKDGNYKFPFDPCHIDYVILSHSHIDHCGRIPLLYKKGFRGKVLCTKGTKELASIVLRDASNIEGHSSNKNEFKSSKKDHESLYNPEDVDGALNLFNGYNYNEKIQLNNDIYIIFKDAGHLLGSAITEIYESGDKPKIIYSGDLGNIDTPIINDPCKVNGGGCVILESTYGGTLHKINNDYGRFINIIMDTLKNGGNVIIPSFAIGRAQEILYILNNYVENGCIESRVKVFMDSPLAIKATEIFEKYKDYYDEEAKKLLKHGDDPLFFNNLVFTKHCKESRIIDEEKGSIIIASSGMCEGGRIIYHLYNNIEDDKSSLIFTGYQAKGTLGRLILNGAKNIDILDSKKEVRCGVYRIPGLSGHADKSGLINWIDSFKYKPDVIYLVHGDDEEKISLRDAFKKKGIECIIAERYKEVNL